MEMKGYLLLYEIPAHRKALLTNHDNDPRYVNRDTRPDMRHSIQLELQLSHRIKVRNTQSSEKT